MTLSANWNAQSTPSPNHQLHVEDLDTNGTVTYLRGKPFADYALRAVDRAGKLIAAQDESGLYFFPRFSPMGNQVAYYAPDLQSGKTNVYVWDLASGNRTRTGRRCGRRFAAGIL